jgi:hypothetical protein
MVIIFSFPKTLHYYNNFVLSAIFRFVTRGCSGVTSLESQLINKSRKLKEFVGKEENPLNNKSS